MSLKIMKINRNLHWHIHRLGSTSDQTGIISNVGFCGGSKTREPGEKPPEKIWHQLWDSNSGHTGGRQAISPLCHRSFPLIMSSSNKIPVVTQSCRIVWFHGNIHTLHFSQRRLLKIPKGREVFKAKLFRREV